MNDYETLKRELEELKVWKSNMERSSSIPLNIDQAFRERFLSGSSAVLGVDEGGTGAATLTGVLIGNGTSPFTTQVGQTIIVYVADSSGGVVNRKLTFTSGVLTGTS